MEDKLYVGDELSRLAVANLEGTIAKNGALVVDTGKRTGRSPKARFIVKDDVTKKTVAWGKTNQAMTTEKFNSLWNKACEYKHGRNIYKQNLSLGHDENYAISVVTETELASHAMFLQNMFINKELSCPERPQWHLISLAELNIDTKAEDLEEDGVVVINFTSRQVLILGMKYAGEMKKALFSVLNFILPSEDVFPMHCAASSDENGNTALYFGLSGTGKTTLSADPSRLLIGDDEHGWSKSGIFNFEGGCYAKCIDLCQKQEPVIWDAIRHGTLLENVVLDANLNPDFADSSKTKNSRAAYPLDFINNRVDPAIAGHPNSVIFLTCDLFGVLPAVSLLDKRQAAYYFLSGYTALVGSTEVGSSAEIATTFSTCFGAPFFARPPQVYADLLIKRLDETGAQVLLVNTGWFGGQYGKGKRFPINITRSIVNAAIKEKIDVKSCWTLPGFEFLVPEKLSDIDGNWLDPRLSWQDRSEYERCSLELRTAFINNFNTTGASDDIKQSGPRVD